MRRATAAILLLSLFPLILPASFYSIITATAVILKGGDTTWYTAWGGSGGNFSGGRVFGTWNDGYWDAPPSYNVGLMELVTYDPVTPANNVLTVANQMTGYGTVNTKCPGGGAYWKTAAPWMVQGILYLAIQCVDTNNFFARASGIICSDDYGAHWTNYGHWLSNGHTCHADANGDAPTDTDTQMQWPVGDFDTSQIHGFTRPLVLSKDNASNPTIPGMDTSYLHFLQSSSGDTSPRAIYIRRAPISSDTAKIMDPSNWQMRSGSSWVADSGTPTNQTGLQQNWWCCVSIAYLQQFGLWVGINADIAAGYPYFTSDLPWNTFTQAGLLNPGVPFVWNVIAPWNMRTSGGAVLATLPGSDHDNGAHGVQFYELSITQAPSSKANGVVKVNGTVTIK